MTGWAVPPPVFYILVERKELLKRSREMGIGEGRNLGRVGEESSPSIA